MISFPVEGPGWTPRRWWIAIVLVFSGQLGLIFWLSDTSVVRPRQAARVPMVSLAEKMPADLLALSDPTLFALPRRQGFSGLAWLNIPPAPNRSFEWSEDPAWLKPSVQRLGASLDRAMEADSPDSLPRLSRPIPRLTIGDTLPPLAAPGRSVLRLEGDLATRKLITPISLPSRPFSDLLANSVVQVVVDEKGWLASVPILLPPGSGDPHADEEALRWAQDARFEPIASTGPNQRNSLTPRLTWGLMVFQWHTLPERSTNSPRPNP